MRIIASECVDMDTVLLICFILSHVCFVDLVFLDQAGLPFFTSMCTSVLSWPAWLSTICCRLMNAIVGVLSGS